MDENTLYVKWCCSNFAQDILCKITGCVYRMNFQFDNDVNGMFTLDLEFQSNEVEMKIPYLF